MRELGLGWAGHRGTTITPDAADASPSTLDFARSDEPRSTLQPVPASSGSRLALRSVCKAQCMSMYEVTDNRKAHSVTVHASHAHGER